MIYTPLKRLHREKREMDLKRNVLTLDNPEGRI